MRNPTAAGFWLGLSLVCTSVPLYLVGSWSRACRFSWKNFFGSKQNGFSLHFPLFERKRKWATYPRFRWKLLFSVLREMVFPLIFARFKRKRKWAMHPRFCCKFLLSGWKQNGICSHLPCFELKRAVHPKLHLFHWTFFFCSKQHSFCSHFLFWMKKKMSSAPYLRGENSAIPNLLLTDRHWGGRTVFLECTVKGLLHLGWLNVL